jgi:hypothetical protein
MVQQLRNMGFTDMREKMLSEIRAITPDGGSLFIPNQWNNCVTLINRIEDILVT